MPNTTTLQKKTVRKALVVEDEGEMGLLLNLFLDEKDFELDYVKNLLSAEEYLQNEQPAIVILDNKLPDGFGVDFIGYIKKKYPQIKIIMNGHRNKQWTLPLPLCRLMLSTTN